MEPEDLVSKLQASASCPDLLQVIPSPELLDELLHVGDGSQLQSLCFIHESRSQDEGLKLKSVGLDALDVQGLHVKKLVQSKSNRLSRLAISVGTHDSVRSLLDHLIWCRRDLWRFIRIP